MSLIDPPAREEMRSNINLGLGIVRNVALQLQPHRLPHNDRGMDGHDGGGWEGEKVSALSNDK